MIVIQRVLSTLVIVLILGTVAPGVVLAEDSVEINNSVHSSSNTGGNTSVDGRAGVDGEPGSPGMSGNDGEDGADGADGSDGADIIEGESHAEVRVENVMDGDVVTDIVTSSTGRGAVEVDMGVTTTADSAPKTDTANDSPEVSGDTDTKTAAAVTASPFDRFVTAVRSLIQKYVSTLF